MADSLTQSMKSDARSNLISSARKQFGSVGYIKTVMDDLTAEFGFTRGALYYHFGDKQGLFKAVLSQLDEEIDIQLLALSSRKSCLKQQLNSRCHGFLTIAIMPEVKQIMLLDASSVLDPHTLHTMNLKCIDSMAELFDALMSQALCTQGSAYLLAKFVYGGLIDIALWVAQSDNQTKALSEAIDAVDVLLEGLYT